MSDSIVVDLLVTLFGTGVGVYFAQRLADEAKQRDDAEQRRERTEIARLMIGEELRSVRARCAVAALELENPLGSTRLHLSGETVRASLPLFADVYAGRPGHYRGVRMILHELEEAGRGLERLRDLAPTACNVELGTESGPYRDARKVLQLNLERLGRSIDAAIEVIDPPAPRTEPTAT